MKPDQQQIVSCSSRVPVIRRARNFYIYDMKGNRYLDLYRDNGNCLFGHRPAGSIKALKIILEKGLGARLPSVYNLRLKNELAAFFPEYNSFSVFPSLAEALDFFSIRFGKKINRNDIYNPFYSKNNPGSGISWWRPYSEKNIHSEIILPVFSAGFGDASVLVCQKKKGQDSVPIFSSPVILQSLRSALSLYKQTLVPEWIHELQNKRTDLFYQDGIYLCFQKNRAHYRAVFDHFLGQGVLLSPFNSSPSILPFDVSENEIKKLTQLLEKGGTI
ncbi:MAG: hypothetical protein JW904_00510 [Spirochaetales bacterium]|nr:hypothetical protein [Spirochaetales bacterium]